MSDADEALIEKIARVTCGSPSDYEWRTWGEDDPGLRAITLQYAARLLPIIRKAERDAAREAVELYQREVVGWQDETDDFLARNYSEEDA